ncbi:MAG: hypothetical protein IPK99_07925 [Flavobacteriales bacterium]|nr:hypothetical protein [Flavobacteriales bacterium]
MRTVQHFLAALVILGIPSIACAQEKEKEKEKEKPESKVVYAYPETSITKHGIVINGERIAYTATVGHLVLLDEKGVKRSHNFYIAYTRDQVSEPSKRPITFAFNGGPGSSSVWLHGCAWAEARGDGR